MCEPARVVVIVHVFEAAVLWQGRDMREVHDVARVHQTIHEPVPIIGGLHGNALQRLTERSEGHKDFRQLVAESRW